MIVTLNPTGYNNLDVLMRVYKNQDLDYWAQTDRDEEKQICGDILYRGEIRDNRQGMAWLPKGIVTMFAEELEQLKHKYITIGIFNELDDNVGELTSCRLNFEATLKIELERIGVKFDVDDIV